MTVPIEIKQIPDLTAKTMLAEGPLSLGALILAAEMADAQCIRVLSVHNGDSSQDAALHYAFRNATPGTDEYRACRMRAELALYKGGGVVTVVGLTKLAAETLTQRRRELWDMERTGAVARRILGAPIADR